MALLVETDECVKDGNDNADCGLLPLDTAGDDGADDDNDDEHDVDCATDRESVETKDGAEDECNRCGGATAVNAVDEELSPATASLTFSLSPPPSSTPAFRPAPPPSIPVTLLPPASPPPLPRSPFPSLNRAASGCPIDHSW